MVIYELRIVMGEMRKVIKKEGLDIAELVHDADAKFRLNSNFSCRLIKIF